MRFDDHPLATIALELVPAGIFAGSIGFAAASLSGQPFDIGAPAAIAGVAFLLAWTGLRRFGATGHRYFLPPFEPSALAAEVEPGRIDAGLRSDGWQWPIVPVDIAPAAGPVGPCAEIDRDETIGQPSHPIADDDLEIVAALEQLRRSLR